MNFFSTFLNTLLVAGVLFYGIGQWRSGRTKKNGEDIASANTTIDLVRKQADALEVELKKANEKIHNNEISMTRLEESIRHKDLLLEQYLNIITNRNPDLEATLKEVRDFLKVLNTKLGDGGKVVS